MAQTKGAVNSVKVYALSGTTVGALLIALDNIGSSQPQRQQDGLYNLDLEHVQYDETFTNFLDANAPYDPTGSSNNEEYEYEDGNKIGGSTSASPDVVVIWHGPHDLVADTVETLAFVAKVSSDSGSISTKAGQFNKPKTSFVGQKPSGTISVVNTKYDSGKVTGVTGSITTSNGYLRQWLDAA